MQDEKEIERMIFESNNTDRSKYIPMDKAIKQFEKAFKNNNYVPGKIVNEVI